MLKLPIICSGGIGDTLLILSRVPISVLGRLGLRFEIFYESGDHPARKILVPFFSKIKYVQFSPGDPGKNQRRIFQKLMSLSQRMKTLWRVPIIDRPAGAISQKTIASSAKILLQTHLDGHHGWKGATAKIWKIERWIELSSELHQRGYDVALMEWDVPSRTQIMQECPFITDASGGDLADLCAEISKHDLLVSIDSWTKYPAEWHSLKQVIIVPNLNNGYMPVFDDVSADYVAGWWFNGLLDNRRVKVIGLELRDGKYAYSLPSLDDLSVDSLVTEIEKLLPAPLSSRCQPKG